MLYSNFEQICTEKREAEEQFDKDFEESLKKFFFFWGLVFCFYDFLRVFIDLFFDDLFVFLWRVVLGFFFLTRVFF